jgi:hypothetical protein
MAKRLRRIKTLTVGGASVTGVRDFTYSPANVQTDRTRADNEAVGDQVMMGSDGFDISFELLMPSANVVNGMVAAMVATGQVVERTDSTPFETVTDVVLTFAQGHLEVGGNLNTDNPGRIPVKGNFKTLAIT